jgi:branched-subunit amino acid aminotransferase/4-amino-4-deoxychorismate lyase
MSILYVNNNGQVLPNNLPTINFGNRGHLYGDGVFESVRVINGKPINVENHFVRLSEGAKSLKMNLNDDYSAHFFEKKIQELIHKSALKLGAKCRISLDRMPGGAYLPESNDSSFYIDVQPLAKNYYELNSKGLETDIYLDLKLGKTFLSQYKTKNGLKYIMASLSAKEKGLDDVFLTNERGQVIETTNSNIFVVHNGVLYTPGIEDGCIAGTMRMQIINLALAHKIKVYECPILPQNMLSADELFLTNAIQGIRWVGGFRSKKYSNTMARRFVVLLNEFWEKRISE